MVTKSSVSGSGSLGPSGTRDLKIVPGPDNVDLSHFTLADGKKVDNPSFKVLYQPLRKDQRLSTQIAVETLVTPLTIGLASSEVEPLRADGFPIAVALQGGKTGPRMVSAGYGLVVQSSNYARYWHRIILAL